MENIENEQGKTRRGDISEAEGEPIEPTEAADLSSKGKRQTSTEWLRTRPLYVAPIHRSAGIDSSRG